MPQLSGNRRVRAVLTLAAALVTGFLFGPGLAHATEIVQACAAGEQNDVWVNAGSASPTCSGGALGMDSDFATGGVAGALTATAPAGLEIVTPLMTAQAPVETPPSGSPYEWSSQYSWSSGYLIFSGNDRCLSGCGLPSNLDSRMFSIALVCPEGCNDSASLRQPTPDLLVAETTMPTLTPAAASLGASGGWVRGTWPLDLQGSAPSGLCSISATLDGLGIGQTSSTPNTAEWQQCSSSSLTASVNTAAFPNGTDPLEASASSAAGNTATLSRTVQVDNVTPTVTFSGPMSALSTAGPQTVTATVGTGPSGAYGASCSVGGGAATFYPGATVAIPVSGVGAHTVMCTGESEAVSSTGQHASSSPTSTTLDIQQPTEAAISFADLRDALKCRTVTERVKKLGKRRTIRLHGHKVQVRRVRYVKRHVRRCQAHTIKRRVLVELKRDGKVVRRHGHIVRVRRTRRVVVLPHRIHETVRQIRHGRGTTVSGVLLLSNGTPLVGQTVTVYASPNAAPRVFSAIAHATTNANGFWVARIPAGPSRLLEAEYAGASTTAPASTTTVKLKVPARLRIVSFTPRVAWGDTVVFHGRVYGGHIPSGGINLRLSYRYHHHWILYGIKTHVPRSGRFSTSFVFGPGPSSEHLHVAFRFASLPGGDFPWSPADSNIATVLVGGRPDVAHQHRARAHYRQDHRR